MNIKELGINKVAILDDDLAINYSYDLISQYADEDCLNSLSDPDSPSFQQLKEILETLKMPFESLEEIIDSFNNEEVVRKAPEYYIEGFILPIEEHKKELKRKIDLIVDCLISLGVERENITFYGSVDEAKQSLVKVELFIIDLFLKEGEPDISLGFLSELAKDASEQQQFILMSYAKELLSEYFRTQHVRDRICSAQLKVISKPMSSDNNEKIRWEQLLQQVALERKLIPLQREMQNKWTELVEIASDKFIRKLWSLDNFGINKLRITASADDMSLSEYLVSAIYKALLAEVEKEGNPNLETLKLENCLRDIDDAKLIKPSNEVNDSYQELNSFIADLTSHRACNLRQINDVENGGLYEGFISNLSYGTILKKNNDKKYFLHLTQPCDYIHVKKAEAKNNKLFLFPGNKHGAFSVHRGGNKKYLSSFVNTIDGIVNIEWDLRQVDAISVKDLFDSRNEYTVVGELRDEEAQAISHQFSSSMSRIATSRMPWFASVDCAHVISKMENEEQKFYYVELNGNQKSLTKISEIASENSNAIKYRHHIDKRINKKKEQYVVTTELNSIPDILDNLTVDEVKIESHFYFPDSFILNEYNIYDSQDIPLTIIFKNNFKDLLSNKDNEIINLYKSYDNHHFFVLLD
ncbi:hypothetical protein [Vibrio metschnikovii]|uniref:hypothetical protein n=1 Tax=Vibrio metschnikovii TaxID=28172 RepID=UPI002FCA7D83